MFLFIAHISALSILVPLVSLLAWKKHFIGFRALFFFVSGSAAFELFFYVTSFLKIRNLPFFHLYTLFEFLSLSILIVGLLDGSKKILVRFLIFSVVMYLLINPFLWEDLNSYNSVSRSVSSLVLIFLYSSFFYKVFSEETVQHLESQPSFWFVVGILTYLIMGIFTHLVADYILKGSIRKDTLLTSYAFVHVSNILKNVAISVGIWKANR